jgi:hypothetical protein
MSGRDKRDRCAIAEERSFTLSNAATKHIADKLAARLFDCRQTL